MTDKYTDRIHDFVKPKHLELILRRIELYNRINGIGDIK